MSWGQHHFSANDMDSVKCSIKVKIAVTFKIIYTPPLHHALAKRPSLNLILHTNNASSKKIRCRASVVLRKSKVSSGRKRSFGEGAWQLVGWLFAIQHPRLFTDQKKKLTLGAKE